MNLTTFKICNIIFRTLDYKPALIKEYYARVVGPGGLEPPTNGL